MYTKDKTEGEELIGHKKIRQREKDTYYLVKIR